MHKFRDQKIVGLAVCLLSLMFVSTVFGFQDGTRGTPGDPGTDGGNAADGEDKIRLEPGIRSTSVLDSRAENGYWGGKGGNGVDGPDEDDWANGGDGGNGGNGGKAVAGWEGIIFPGSRAEQLVEDVQTVARGGFGGAGGYPGVGTGDDPDGTNSIDGADGVGGFGGIGGFASTYARGTHSASSRSFGGGGGQALGIGRRGGRGGFARSVSLVSEPDSSVIGDFKSIDNLISGGRGGEGLRGADGGDGASASSGYQMNFRISDMNASQHVFRISAFGGDGGFSVGGQAGMAGNAVIDLAPQIHNGGIQPIQGTQEFTFSGQGGRGGDGSGYATLVGTATDGGSAFVKSDVPLSLEGDALISMDMRGGNGGQWSHKHETGIAGDGGAAIISPWTINQQVSDSSAGSRLDFRVDLRGGAGGTVINQSHGLGGDGASVNLVDKFTLNVQDNFDLDILSSGGDAGRGTSNGNGGDSYVSLIESVVQSSRTSDAFAENDIRVTATGGFAGQALGAENEADGGNAFVDVVQTSNRRLTINTTAGGGHGNFGESGYSVSKIFGESTGEGELGGVNLTAKAQNARRRFGSSAVGADARAVATGVSRSSSVSWVTATADGGWGSNRSGFANASASIVNSSVGDVNASSTSTSRSDRSFSSANYATSIADATTEGGVATSYAQSKAFGHFSRARSLSSINAKSGTALARSLTTTNNWSHFGYIQSFVRLDESTGNDLTASSYLAFRRFETPMGGQDAFAHAVVNPGRMGVEQQLIDNPGMANFADPAADILATAHFGGGYDSAGTDGKLTVATMFDLDLELQPWQNDGLMELGLFDPVSTGNGFDELTFKIQYEAQIIDDVAFTDVSDAILYFTDHTFSLATITGDEAILDFNFDFDMVTSKPGDSFSFSLMFGRTFPSPNNFTFKSSSVPEPSAALVLGCVGLFGWRRRRATK